MSSFRSLERECRVSKATKVFAGLSYADRTYHFSISALRPSMWFFVALPERCVTFLTQSPCSLFNYQPPFLFQINFSPGEKRELGCRVAAAVARRKLSRDYEE